MKNHAKFAYCRLSPLHYVAPRYHWQRIHETDGVMTKVAESLLESQRVGFFLLESVSDS